VFAVRGFASAVLAVDDVVTDAVEGCVAYPGSITTSLKPLTGKPSGTVTSASTRSTSPT